ncbi:MAG TPA: laccase domain-containing protein [Candidatus Paceibacterota bacterium]|nr:laccase domain-containing protein [Candidatus Paceibacterota bacterium]
MAPNIAVSTSLGSYSPFSDPAVSISYRGRPFDNGLYGRERADAIRLVRSMAGYAKFSGDVFIPDVRPANGLVVSQAAYKPTASVTPCAVYVGPKADGVTLRWRQAALFCTRDCPTVVMCLPHMGLAVAAHAGRQSLLGGPRFESSVVGEMAKKFSPRDLSRVEVAIVLSVAGERFHHRPDHPVYGPKNRDLIAFVKEAYGSECFVDEGVGALSLPMLVKKQCVQAGIRAEKVFHDGIDTYSATLSKGSGYAFSSHRRGDCRGGNLVFVTVKSC